LSASVFCVANSLSFGFTCPSVSSLVSGASVRQCVSATISLSLALSLFVNKRQVLGQHTSTMPRCGVWRGFTRGGGGGLERCLRILPPTL
jgi:hypothetical protein